MSLNLWCVTAWRPCIKGVVGLTFNKRLIVREVTKDIHNRSTLERYTAEGNGPVCEMYIPSLVSTRVARDP